jgi:hypothetical protein
MSFDNTGDPQKSKQESGTFGEEDKGGDKKPYLVIDGREFATQEDVIKHISSAQEHISTLEGENRSYRETQEQLKKAADENISARELLEGIHKATTQPKAPETPALSKEEIAAEAAKLASQMVDEKLKSDRVKEAEQANLSECLQSAEQALGEDYIQRVNEIGKAHNLSGAQIDNLAKTAPSVFKRLFLPEDKKGKGPSDGEYNTAAFNKVQEPEKRTSIMSVTDNKSRANLVQERIAAKLAEANN